MKEVTKEAEVSQEKQKSKGYDDNNAGSIEKAAPNPRVGLCVCPGFLFVGTADLIDCTAGDNCTKITPCPCQKAANEGNKLKSAEGQLQRFDNSVENNNIDKYFRSNSWQKLSPN